MEQHEALFAALDVDNYSKWSVRMQMYLVVKDCWEAVDPGTVPAAAAAAAAFAKMDMKGRAYIVSKVKDHHLNALKGCASAKDMWTMLENSYKSQNNSRKLLKKCGQSHRHRSHAGSHFLWVLKQPVTSKQSSLIYKAAVLVVPYRHD
jgi:hypothetical protein